MIATVEFVSQSLSGALAVSDQGVKSFERGANQRFKPPWNHPPQCNAKKLQQSTFEKSRFRSYCIVMYVY